MKAAEPGVLLCDFDGTVTDLDTGELVLTRFSEGDWRYYHEQYLGGAYPFEECLRLQYAQLRRASKASILRLVDESVRVRPGFQDLLSAAELRGVPVAVASYGLDFCIDHVLRRLDGGGGVKVYSPRTTVRGGSFRLDFPRRRTKGSTNMKDDLVRWYHRKGTSVAFIGDGASDLPAVEIADRRFAIEGSELDKMCERRGVRCTRVADFRPLAKALARADRPAGTL